MLGQFLGLVDAWLSHPHFLYEFPDEQLARIFSGPVSLKKKIIAFKHVIDYLGLACKNKMFINLKTDHRQSNK